MKKIIQSKTFILGSLLIIVSIQVSLSLKYVNEYIETIGENANTISLVMFYLAEFLVVVISIYSIYFFEKPDNQSISDINRISNVKRKFLDNILETLSLSIDSKLEEQLKNGKIEDANDSITDKIEALNKLIETVKGDNSKSLRGTDISTVSEFYESTSLRIKSEIERIRLNSSVNLVIGITLTIIAIGVLSISLINHDLKVNEIVPRVTLSVLIEAFSFSINIVNNNKTLNTGTTRKQILI